nr:phosphoenolpyruvate carboxykinase [ATP]-like [Ipomoea batatas]
MDEHTFLVNRERVVDYLCSLEKVFKCVRSVWNNVEVDQNMMVESPFPDDFVSPPVVLPPRVQADPPLDDSNHGLANLA